jgi:hypothetical protein
MEILMLVLLYYLSQNPNFAESVKPLMANLKDSQQMLDFLNDLSKFTQTFSTLQTSKESGKTEKKEQKENAPKPQDKKEPQSPTSGIADEFIERILNGYLQKH